MKAKIFSKLKQEYSALGLGDEILQGRADALAKTGLVTDDNIDLIVSVQKEDLEALQKLNDKRVSSALEKQRQAWEEESRKQKEAADKAAEEDAKKKAAAEEEARKKADKEKADKEAKSKAEKEAEAEKAAAEEEARKLAELEAAKAIPEDVLNYLKDSKSRAEKERAEYQKQIKSVMDEAKARQNEYLETLKQLQEANKKLSDNYSTLDSNYAALRKEADDARQAKEKIERQQFILNKAKELGIPQWRVDEGFVIADDATEEAISNLLSKVSSNIKTELLPQERPAYTFGSTEPTKDEIADLAASVVNNTK